MNLSTRINNTNQLFKIKKTNKNKIKNNNSSLFILIRLKNQNKIDTVYKT